MQIQVSTSYTFIYAARDLFLDIFFFFYIFKISTFTFRFCGSCVRTKEREDKDKPHVFEPLENEDHDTKALYAMACFKGEQFRVGDSVYLPPEAFNFR